MTTIAAERTNKDEEVQVVTTTGNPAKKRIATAQAAHSLAKKLKDNDSSNALSRARLSSIYDGNPPLSNAELRRRGLAWTSNFDWGEFRSTINESATSIWNMFNAMEHLVKLSTTFTNPQDPGVDYGEIVANEFSEIVRGWNNYNFVTMMSALSLMKYGIGVLSWPDVNDWRPKPIKEGCFLVPSKTKSSPGNLFTVVIMDEMDPHYIFTLIADEESASSLGWNVAYLKQKLVKQYIDGVDAAEDDQQNSSWESLQNQIATKISETNEEDLDPVRVIHFYSSEFPDTVGEESGGVTHQIVIDGDDEIKEFIFEKEARFDDMAQAIHVTLYHVGNGLMKSVRGLGREIYYSSHASNRMLNNILTGITISSGIMLKPTGEVSREATRIMRHGVVTVLPQNADIVQQQFHPNIKASAEVRNLINSVSANNSSGYKANQEKPNPVERTAREAELSFQNEATFKQDQAEWLYSQRTSLMQEMFRRLMDPDYPKDAPGYSDHIALFDALKERGVPAALLKADAWRLKVPRAVGLGNRTIALGISNQSVKMKGSLDEDGRRHVDRIWWALRYGWDQVDKFVPVRSRDNVITVGHTMAEGENIDMLQGHPRQVAVDDPHKIHADMHIKSAANILQGTMAGKMDPEQGLNGFHTHLQHIATHIAQMSADETREQQVKEYSQTLRKLVAASKELEAMVKKIIAQREQEQAEVQKQLQENQQKNVDIELGRYEIDQKMALRAADTESMNENRMAKTIAGIQAKYEETHAKIRMMEEEMAANRRARSESDGDSG